MPLYNAFLAMGAISPDKINLHFSEHDEQAFRVAMHKRAMAKNPKAQEELRKRRVVVPPPRAGFPKNPGADKPQPKRPARGMRNGRRP